MIMRPKSDEITASRAHSIPSRHRFLVGNLSDWYM